MFTFDILYAGLDCDCCQMAQVAYEFSESKLFYFIFSSRGAIALEINALDFLETFCQDWGYVFKNLTIIESLTLVGLNFWFIMAAASHL